MDDVSGSDSKPKLGIVVGGTGVRGFAQAGALAALERAGLGPDVVVGVSTGAIVAAAYAARADWSDALQQMDRTKLPALASGSSSDDTFARLRAALRSARQLAPSVWTWGRQGYAEYGRAALADLLGPEPRLGRTRVPLALVATDLERGERTVLDRGPLAQATLAASALPGLARPVPIGARLLADGAFSDPVPIDVARDLGADVVLVVHTQPPLAASDPDNWILALVRGMEIGQQAFADERLGQADIVVRATLDATVRSLDFAGLDAAARRTGAAVSADLDKIRERLDAAARVPRRQTAADSGTVPSEPAEGAGQGSSDSEK